MPSLCFSLDCAVKEPQPLAFSPPGIRGSRVQCLGKSRGSHFPAAPPAELCHGPAWQLPAVPGSGGCEKSPIPHSLRLSGQARAVTGAGDAPASSREGSPSSQQLPRTSRGCSAQRAARPALGRGAAAMVSWGNRAVTVGRVTSGMETETQGFRLGVCLSKIFRSWVSDLPRPNPVDVVTLLCLLPAPAVASSRSQRWRDGRAGCSLRCSRSLLRDEHGRKLYITQ